jgi:hypothetical protein
MPTAPRYRLRVMAWLFGRREYARPALRWAVVPLFRLAWIPFLVNVFLNFKSTALLIAFLALIVCSTVAEGINAVMLRRRKARIHPSG